MALGLAGLLDIGSSLASLGSGLAARQGSAPFFTGVLADRGNPRPCGAPFMSIIAFAVAQPTAVLLLLPCSPPFLVQAFWPAFAKGLAPG